MNKVVIALVIATCFVSCYANPFDLKAMLKSKYGNHEAVTVTENGFFLKEVPQSAVRSLNQNSPVFCAITNRTSSDSPSGSGNFCQTSGQQCCDPSSLALASLSL